MKKPYNLLEETQKRFKYRKDTGLSQADFALSIGVTVSWYQKLESGLLAYPNKLDSIQRVHDALVKLEAKRKARG